MDYSPATPDYEPPTFDHRLVEDEDSGWVTPTHEFQCSPRGEKSVAGHSVSQRRRHDRLRNDRDEDDDTVGSRDDDDDDDDNDDDVEVEDNGNDCEDDDESEVHNVSGEHVPELEDENDTRYGDDVASMAEETRRHDVAERSVDCTDDSRLETEERAEEAVPLNSPFAANEDALPVPQQQPSFASQLATADVDTVVVVDGEDVEEQCGASSRDCSDDSRAKQRRSQPKGAKASGSPDRARNASRRSSTSSSSSASSTASSSSSAVHSSVTTATTNVAAVTSPSRVAPTTVAMDAHESQQAASISATNRGAGQGKQARTSAVVSAGSSAAAAVGNSLAANGGGSSNSRKRKLQAVNVNLLHFAHALWEAYLDACPQDRKGSKRYVTSKNLLSFLRYAPNNEDLVQHLDAIGVQQRPVKRAREYVPLVADTGAVAASRSNDAKVLESRSDDETGDETARVEAAPIGEKSPDETKDTRKQSIMLQLTMRLMADIESAGIGYQFSREALKCFLATYSQILTPDDFGNARIAEAVMRGSGGAVSWQETSVTAARRSAGGDSSSSSGRRTSSNGSRKPSPNSVPSTAKNGKRSSTTTAATTAVAATARRNNGRESGSKLSSSRSGRNGVGVGRASSSSSPAKATATAVAAAPTTSSTGNERHNKSNAPLPPGGILLEYVKGISSFLANVNRSDPNDLDALCFILRHRITLNSGIYSSLFRMRVQDLTYDVDRQNRGNEAGYVRVPAVNFKRAVLLLGHSVVMQLEGHHFVVASGTVEKDVPSSEIPRSRGEYVVFDVMLGTRNKILDVLECRLKDRDDNQLPDNYLDRLRWIATRFPGLKCVTVAGSGTAGGGGSSTTVVPTSQLDVDSGYVRKSIDDPRGTVFVYTKPPMTAACVGFSNKHVHLAFREQAQPPTTSSSSSSSSSLGSTTRDTEPPRLVVKTKCAINGPATFAIGIASQQKLVRPDSQGRLFVSCNGTRYELLGADAETVRVFDEAIPVEFKDGSKLGGLSDYEVSSVNEFKPPSALKDSAIAEAASVAQHDLKRFFAVYTQKYGCREFLAQIQEWNRNMVQPLDFSDYD